MSCLVPYGYRIDILSQHIRYACVFQRVELVSGRESQFLSQYSAPIVSEAFLAPIFSSWPEVTAEQIVAAWMREYVKFQHQFKDFLRHRHHCIIVVLGILSPYSYCLSLYADVFYLYT